MVQYAGLGRHVPKANYPYLHPSHLTNITYYLSLPYLTNILPLM